MNREASYKNTVIVYIIRLIELLMQIMVFSLTYMFILIGFMGREDFSPLACIAIAGIPVSVLYIVRGWCTDRAVTILAHAAAVLPAFIIMADKIAMAAYIVVYAAMIIYSIGLILGKKNHTDEHMAVGMVLYFITVMIVGEVTKRAVIEQWALYFGIVFIILEVLYHNINNMNDIMIMSHDVKNFPAKQMVSVNAFIMTAVAVICIGAMFIIDNPYVYRMLDALKNIIFAFLRIIFGFIGGGTEDEPIIEEPAAPEAPNEGMQLPMESGIIQDILNGLAMILGIAMIIMVVICIAAALVRLMKKMHGSDGVSGDIREFVAPDEKKVRLDRTKRRAEHATAGAVDMKVRRIYRSMVIHGAKKKKLSVSYNMTPGEISEKYITVLADDATELYEKARYSNDELSDAELELMKDIKKKQRQKD